MLLHEHMFAVEDEVRYTQTGKNITTFNVAINTGFGENKHIDFVSVISWEKLAETFGNNLTKGRRILVEGRLQIRDYEKDGQKSRTLT
ncbi:single-strand binding protein [Pelosinus sp. UFO1]|nr:single-stranded DNA-binding protein [Pelosinus sp. UFO1]AIF51863.1 single-strand binding protein [Pelosinus sp. UFO1]